MSQNNTARNCKLRIKNFKFKQKYKEFVFNDYLINPITGKKARTLRETFNTNSIIERIKFRICFFDFPEKCLDEIFEHFDRKIIIKKHKKYLNLFERLFLCFEILFK